MRYEIKQNSKLNDYFHAYNFENIQYFESILKYLKLTQNVKGEVVECGVGRGRSLISILYILNKFKSKKKIFAFDSFSGFGKIHKHDKSFRKPKPKDWSSSPNQKIKYSAEFIKKVLSLHMQENKIKIKFYKGYLKKSLPKNKSIFKNKISFINADIDLYEGHKDLLQNLWPFLSKGGIIYFDDILLKKNKLKFPGAKKAFLEFFKKKKNKFIYINDTIRENVVIKKIRD